MTKLKPNKIDPNKTGVWVTILNDWKHPYGTLKEAGTVLPVTSEYAAELVAEGIAEIKN